MLVEEQVITPRRNDTVADTSDFADCLYRLRSTHHGIDHQRMLGLGCLFDAFLARAASDSPEDVTVQVDAVRELAADPRALGRPDRDGTDYRNEAPQRRDAYTWLVERTSSTSLMHMADALDTTVKQVRSRVQVAAAGLVGLPEFTSQARAGVIGYDRYHYGAARAASLEPEYLADFDAGLARIRVSDMTAFKRAVTQLIATLVTCEQRARQVRDRRTVETYYEPHGLGVLIARGPCHQIALLEARLAGMARSVIKGLGAPLGVPADHTITDDRGMGELMFDFLTGSRPAGTLTTQSTGSDSDTTPGRAGDSVVTAANPAGIDLDATAEKIAETLAETGVRCPVDAEWLKRQARITITVPALTLLDRNTGEEDDAVRVPGMVNGHPIAPETARQLTGTGHSTLYRILTDPTDGTVLDHAAEAYTIPEKMRIALVEKWQFCTLPGCHRSALKAELDHIEPFNHEDPGRGGPTSMGNLHSLCREHHQMKTDDRLRVTRHPETGMLTWTLPGGHQLQARPPSNPIGQTHAQQLLNLTTD